MRILKYTLLILLLFVSITGLTQPYTSWKLGNTTDINTTHQKGCVLAGGGGDNDDAMTWMLERAQGGDVVIIRTSGSDGYNSYFYNDLGVSLNSVETLLIPSVAAANDPYVLQQVANAEVLFIAGGDQYTYYQYWRGTLLNDTLNYLINTKNITVGGTSAGMMILGKTYYAPDQLGVLSSEALGDPYHQYMSIIGRDDFIDVPLFQDVIMDTHFDDRSRAGRLSAFMSRMETDWGVNSFGIACNEYTAVCVDENNIARVFGETPSYPDYAYFVQSNCDQPFSLPENCTSGQSLSWVKNNEALKVYKIGGNVLGANRFNLNDWQTAAGGVWEDWHITNGVLTQTPSANGLCATSNLDVNQKPEFSVYPNPINDEFGVYFNGFASGFLSIYDISGKLLTQANINGNNCRFSSSDWPSGTYIIQVQTDKETASLKVVK